MKTICLFVSLQIFNTNCFAQANSQKDSSGCKCNNEYSIKNPNVREEDERYGKLTASYEVDSVCRASKPKIITGLGPAYDKEVLRVLNQIIADFNSCSKRCRFKSCKVYVKELSFTFLEPEVID